MRLLKVTVLAAAVVAMAAPALAGAGCGGYKAKQQSAQTVVTPTGPQTVVIQSAEKSK